jgi:hypothetical protein
LKDLHQPQQLDAVNTSSPLFFQHRLPQITQRVDIPTGPDQSSYLSHFISSGDLRLDALGVLLQQSSHHYFTVLAFSHHLKKTHGAKIHAL